MRSHIWRIPLLERIPLLGDIVERSLNRLFERLGEFIGLHPLPFIIVPIFATVILSFGMIRGRLEENVQILYTPIGAPSRHEFDVSEAFFHADDTSLVRYVDLLFYVKNDPDDDENMLSKTRTDFILEFHKYVTKNLTYTYDGEEYNFGKHMCDRAWCDFSNKPLTTFLSVFPNKKLLSNPNVRLEYPVLEAFGTKVFLGYHIFGVPTEHNRTAPYNISAVPTEHNRTERLTEAKLFRLHYVIDLKFVNLTVGDFHAFQSSLLDYVDSVRGTENIDIIVSNSDIMGYEVQRNTIACIPYVMLTFFTLAIFTIVSTMRSDMITSKPWEALMGAVACLMAIVSSFGFMFYFGYAFNSTVSVMPFLAFAIGIDDTFIALSSWHATDPSLPPHKRLAMSFRESGTAITVTSLTDVVLFGLCAISTTPAIIVFSIFTAVAMAFDYIYQLTFFTAVLAYAGRREARKLNSFIPICCWNRRKPNRQSSTDKNIDSNLQFVQKKLTSNSNTELIMSRIFRTKVAPMLTNPIVKIIIFILYLFYIVVGFYGVSKMKIDMGGSKTLLDNSPLQPYFDVQKRFLWEYIQAQIFVRKAPDFRNETERKMFDMFLDDLESMPYSLGPASTILWYREFQEFIQYIDHTPDEFYKYVKQFMDISVHAYFRGQIHWRLGYRSDPDDYTNCTIPEFVFTSGFSAKEQGWEGRLNLLRAWRNISARYTDYEVVIFDGDNFFADQYDTLDDETIQQVGIALIGMTMMAAVFIPHIASIFWIGWTLLSMDFGIVGLLMLWGCDLDPMVMMNIVMSLDFAVEYAAHTCHRYYVSKEYTGADKLSDTLATMGWPVLQGGMAAIIAVLPLTFVHSYIIRAFFKTVVLVVGIGLIHGLILLPVFVSSVSRIRFVPSKSIAKIRQDLMVQKVNKG